LMNHASFPRTIQRLQLSWFPRMKKWRSPSTPSNSSRCPVLGAKEQTPIRYTEQQIDPSCENSMHFQRRTEQLAISFIDVLELLFEPDCFDPDFLDERERSTDWRRASIRSTTSPPVSSSSSSSGKVSSRSRVSPDSIFASMSFFSSSW